MKLTGHPVSVEALLEGAKGYLSALGTLAEHPTKQLVEPIGLLASQAVELALKAVLLHGGWTEHQLITKIGHDLRKAWEEAKKMGLEIDWEHRFSVEVLSLSHNSPYLFRYPRERIGAAITEPEVLCNDVKAVIDAAERHVAN